MPSVRSAFAFLPCALAAVLLLDTVGTAAGMRSVLSPGETAENAAAAATVVASNAKPADRNTPLAARPGVNHTRFATLIAARVRSTGVAQITAVGPAPSYMVFKALLHASRFLRKEFPGKIFGVLPSKHAMTLKSGIDTTGFLLEVRAVKEVSLSAELDTSIGGDSNAGTVSACMVQHIKEKNMVTLGAMGPSAVYSVLKAAVYAQDNMAHDPAESSVQLALVPKFRKVQTRGENLTQMVLTCVRLRE